MGEKAEFLCPLEKACGDQGIEACSYPGVGPIPLQATLTFHVYIMDFDTVATVNDGSCSSSSSSSSFDDTYKKIRLSPLPSAWGR